MTSQLGNQNAETPAVPVDGHFTAADSSDGATTTTTEGRVSLRAKQLHASTANIDAPCQPASQLTYITPTFRQ